MESYGSLPYPQEPANSEALSHIS